jgi:Protein of unknown function (DUF3108)
LAAALLAGSAYYWLRESSGRQPALTLAREAQPAARPAEGTPTEPAKAIASRSTPEAEPNRMATPEPEPGQPLRTGEVLDYTADVAKVSNVASLRLQVVERRNFVGKSAWHLQAFAHTQSPLRMVFELDDQFDSYSDAGTLTSLQYEMHLSERGQKVDSIQRLTTGKEPAPPNASQTHVLAGTRDPLGMMQFLRHVNWATTHEVHGPVYDGRKLYDVRATLAASAQNVTVPAGTYVADKVEIRVFDNDAEMKDAHFFAYFAGNEARTPVLLEAEMPFANARVALSRSK